MSPPTSGGAPADVTRPERVLKPLALIRVGAVNPGQFEPAGDLREETHFDEHADLLAALTPKQRLTYQVRETALRYLLGYENRPFSELAKELGVTRAALSKIHRDLLFRLGFRDHSAWRGKLSRATSANWAKRKGVDTAAKSGAARRPQ